MSNTAPEVRIKTAIEVTNCVVDYSGKLDAGERISISPIAPTFSEFTINESTGAETASSDLTIDNIQVNASTIEPAAANRIGAARAVTFRAAGGTAGKLYRLKVTSKTSQGQTRSGRVHLRVIAD